ncbi:Beta-lactamase enzyme family protein [Klenkia soli]|uniref:Beta-lactamase enzyme family protein n=1 Tax=Klenkia soli TaxID=1052260 RepID=A0A1H0GJN0_9ACTN|nr:serine hydrolase [Klenkia soli]SDO07078.1 Beta-lactamase enzyme family protein [Klenkia soli]
MTVAAVLVAGLLVEADAASAAPAVPAPTPVLTAPAVPGRTAAVVPPATVALAAFGGTGSLVALVGPSPRPVSSSAGHRGTAAPSTAGDVDAPVPTASLVKLYLAEGILSAARTAGTVVPELDLARITAMLTTSDDTAASELWVAHDGPAVVVDVAARYGLRATAPPTPDPGAWGSATTSAADLATFLADLPDRAHPDDADLLLELLAQATPVGADGFDQSFGLLGPTRSADVAAKQGWMCCVAGQRYLHSVGLQDGRVVVLLASFPADVDWSVARAAVDAAATAISR